VQKLTILALAVPDISRAAPKFKVGHVTLTVPLLRVFALRMLGLDIAYMHTKFDDCSFSHSRDMVGANQYLNGSRKLTTPLSWTICHLWDKTCYDQPAYEI